MNPINFSNMNNGLGIINQTAILEKYVKDTIISVSYTKPLTFMYLALLIEVVEFFIIRYIVKKGTKSLIYHKINEKVYIDITVDMIFISLKTLKIVCIIMAIIFMMFNKSLLGI